MTYVYYTYSTLPGFIGSIYFIYIPRSRYTTGSVNTSGRSVPCPPGQISLSGPKFIERPLIEKERRHGVYQAQVLDLDGQAISGPENITWSVSGSGTAAGTHCHYFLVQSPLTMSGFLTIKCF